MNRFARRLIQQRSRLRTGTRAQRLFDAEFYVAQFSELFPIPSRPWKHFLRVGAWQGKNPNLLFDTSWYLEHSPDVMAAGVNPLIHYVANGAHEHRNPHPLFDTQWYREHQPSPLPADANPLQHYLQNRGVDTGDPHPLFDTHFYLDQLDQPIDVPPLVHYLLHGERAGHDPNPWFDVDYYLAEHPDIASEGTGALTHYVREGAARGYQPHPLFEPEELISHNPGIPLASALATFLHGAAGPHPPGTPGGKVGLVSFSPDAALPRVARPLCLRVVRDIGTPALNVLLPGLDVAGLTGGPNTAIRIACDVAEAGFPVRLVATDARVSDPRAVHAHAAAMSHKKQIDSLEVVDGSDRAVPVDIGENDLFLATFWSTAHLAHAACAVTSRDRFVYLIQDFEPLLYQASTEFALAMETYGFPHHAVVNSDLLYRFLAEHGIGQFGDEAHRSATTVLVPTPDPSLYYPVPRSADRARRLLFYTRPSAPRNMYELGLTALRHAVARGVFSDEPWEFATIGNDRIAPVAVDDLRIIEHLGSPPIEEWARLMRESDVLLSLILSPHSGYAALEMAASGGVVVTNQLGPKNEASLARYGSHILAPPLTVEAVAAALARVPELVVAADRERAAAGRFTPEKEPVDWLTPAAIRVRELLA